MDHSMPQPLPLGFAVAEQLCLPRDPLLRLCGVSSQHAACKGTASLHEIMRLLPGLERQHVGHQPAQIQKPSFDPSQRLLEDARGAPRHVDYPHVFYGQRCFQPIRMRNLGATSRIYFRLTNVCPTNERNHASTMPHTSQCCPKQRKAAEQFSRIHDNVYAPTSRTLFGFRNEGLCPCRWVGILVKCNKFSCAAS